MRRRDFLWLSAAALGCSKSVESRQAQKRPCVREMEADVVIVGGGLGGCAAALAALRNGARVILTEETGWIGGQLTQQAVPPDEHPWIESFGCTRTYRRLREGVRDYYRTHYRLTRAAKARAALNPGNGWVSRLCHEPRVALAVLEEMLAPALASGRLTLWRHHRPVGADLDGDRVRAVTVRETRTGDPTVLVGRYFLDATEQGDLLPLARVEHVTGAESQRDTGEPHAPAEAQPHNIQSFTCCFAIDHLDGEDHTIPRPAEYAFWRAYAPQFRPSCSGRLFAWDDPSGRRPFGFDPLRDQTAGRSNLWTYRRILDRSQFVPGTYRSDICLVNWGQNDYFLGRLHAVDADEASRHLERAKGLSLSLLYWLQTEAPRPDGRTGWPGLRLRHDVVGTDDGLAMSPYIRESRRVRAEFTVREQYVSREIREKSAPSRTEAEAEPFPDSVGIGHYAMDLHPSSGGDHGQGWATLPFQIPCGALLPVRVENLLPACKNLGVTHLTNGCYRLHPVEWNIGEAAGALAAFCLGRNQAPRRVRNHAGLLQEFQQTLTDQGVELQWPRSLSG